MTIKLSDVLPIDNLNEFKVHFARWNGINQPLDIFVRNRHEWLDWQQYRGARDEFNRPYIFALAQFYHEPLIWLFCGIYQVLERHTDRYVVSLTDRGQDYIGRLKLRTPYKERSTRPKMEGVYDDFEVFEILRDVYTGRNFPGFENIDVSFSEIEFLIHNGRSDWRAALGSVKGVYLITDTKTLKRYVGSAYGDGGVWSRWGEYAASGHGGNVKLRELVAQKSMDYCREHFRFTLLEHYPVYKANEDIIRREEFWKTLLLTRGDAGYNSTRSII